MPRCSDAREKRHWWAAQESKSKMKIFFSTPNQFGALTRIESSGAILLLFGASSGHAQPNVIALEITAGCIRNA
jgi:hypothetical protein